MHWKENVLRIFKIMAYFVKKIHGEILSREYTLSLPYRHFTYSPWFENWFQEEFARIGDYVAFVTEAQAYMIYSFSRHCLHLEGDFAECGVYKGGTAFLIANTLKNHAKRERALHLFDTFAGMPATAKNDPSLHKEGDFKNTSLDRVKDYLKGFPFAVFHPGMIPETFETVKDTKFSFIHIDIDLYQTTVDCCQFFYGRMVKGGIMIFHDYGFFRYKFAEKKAVDEFFSDKPESPISISTGQCFVVKL